MKKIWNLLSDIGILVLSICIVVLLFLGILFVGKVFIELFGDENKNIATLGINDVIVYTVYISQLAVSGILSFLVYKLTKKSQDRDINIDRKNTINALKYVKNEVNYNKSIISVLESKKIDKNKINKYIFKTEAWDKYNIVLVDTLNSKSYNKLLSYYATIQLYGIKELEKEIISNINNIDEIFSILNSEIDKIK